MGGKKTYWTHKLKSALLKLGWENIKLLRQYFSTHNK